MAWGSEEWVEDALGLPHLLHLGGPPPAPGKLLYLPQWGLACYLAALDCGHVIIDPKLQPTIRPLWRRFLTLLERDSGSIAAIESVQVLGNREKTNAFVLAMFNDVNTKLDEADAVNRVLKVQELRARRIQGRVTALSGEPIRRPSDAAFLLEALPPRRRRDRGKR